MYLCDSWVAGGTMDVALKPATNYEKVAGVYKDVPDETAAWFKIDCGIKQISLRLTWEQLQALYHKLGACLQDAEMMSHPQDEQSADPKQFPF